jgi:hypothetical protein
MKCNKNAYKSLIRKSKIKQFYRAMKNGMKILNLISKKEAMNVQAGYASGE